MMSSSRSHPPFPSPAIWALEDLASFGSGHQVPSGADGSILPDPDAIEREAYARGYQDGQLAGVQAEAARVRDALAAVDEALVILQGEAEAWVGNARENLCALAIGVARQVIMREVTLDPASVALLAAHALAEIPVDQAVVLRLHPDDMTVLEQLPEGEANARVILGRNRTDVQWLADPRVRRGGCLLESRDRIIDGRVDTALERLYRRLSATDA